LNTHGRLPGRALFLSLWIAASALDAAADRLVVPVWPGVPPGSEGKSGAETVRVTEAGEHVVSNVHRPSITVYLPASTGAATAAVLVMPGGGHRELWMDHEGYAVADWLAAHGVAAFVLKYRLASQEGSTYTVEKDALADAQRAMRLIRSRASEWRVDPARLGVMGFSAGGELAARTSMVTLAGDPAAEDPLDRQGTKPAFQALIYPGRSQVIVPTTASPPAFLVWGTGDRPDIAEGMAIVYLLFKRAGVPVEMHVYSDAGHGFGLRQSNHAPSGHWLERFHEWLAWRDQSSN
jgi:acetyl esterase/lipase